MNTLTFVCLKLVRWTGWLLLPVVLAFLATGYAMSGRYGFGVLADEQTALTLHKLMHLPLGLLVLAHVTPSVYLALLRWGWIQRGAALDSSGDGSRSGVVETSRHTDEKRLAANVRSADTLKKKV
ncbi:MAG: hypothetical protein PHE83_06535 [Opitutaceae bacterium]|nr:hypothetical protein [Opitutaceae bacterium]